MRSNLALLATTVTVTGAAAQYQYYNSYPNQLAARQLLDDLERYELGRRSAMTYEDDEELLDFLSRRGEDLYMDDVLLARGPTGKDAADNDRGEGSSKSFGDKFKDFFKKAPVDEAAEAAKKAAKEEKKKEKAFQEQQRSITREQNVNNNLHKLEVFGSGYKLRDITREEAARRLYGQTPGYTPGPTPPRGPDPQGSQSQDDPPPPYSKGPGR